MEGELAALVADARTRYAAVSFSGGRFADPEAAASVAADAIRINLALGPQPWPGCAGLGLEHARAEVISGLCSLLPTQPVGRGHRELASRIQGLSCMLRPDGLRQMDAIWSGTLDRLLATLGELYLLFRGGRTCADARRRHWATIGRLIPGPELRLPAVERVTIEFGDDERFGLEAPGAVARLLRAASLEVLWPEAQRLVAALLADANRDQERLYYDSVLHGRLPKVVAGRGSVRELYLALSDLQPTRDEPWDPLWSFGARLASHLHASVVGGVTGGVGWHGAAGLDQRMLNAAGPLWWIAAVAVPAGESRTVLLAHMRRRLRALDERLGFGLKPDVGRQDLRF